VALPHAGTLHDPVSGKAGVRLEVRGADGSVLYDSPFANSVVTWWDGLPEAAYQPGVDMTMRARYKAGADGPMVIGAAGVGRLRISLNDAMLAQASSLPPRDVVEALSRPPELRVPVHFEAGEEMRTEISAKFTLERVQGDLTAAGLELVRWLTDPQELFALTLSRRAAVRLLGYGHTTDCLPLERKDAPDFSIARRAAERACVMADVNPRDIQAAEVHDCFSISEIVAYEILGFAPRGGGAQLLETGATALPDVRSQIAAGVPPFTLPVNPGGGLIGDGHPVGATGVRQVVEACRQLTGSAGEHQVQGVERFLTFNMGGSVTTSVVMIWGSER